MDDHPTEPTGAKQAPRLQRPIILVGLMGAGKTAVGKRLAHNLGVPFVDSDHAVEAAAGMTIADIFERYGEPEFRALERRVIQRLLNDRSASVVALGGGAFIDAETRALVLEKGHVVWLEADIDILVERTAKKPGKRPLLAKGDPRTILADLKARRDPYYALAHDVVVSGTGPLADVVNQVADKVQNASHHSGGAAA